MKVRMRMNLNNGWEKMITAYIRGAGVLNFQWDEGLHRWLGVKGFRFARINSGTARGWENVPNEWGRFMAGAEKGRSSHFVVFVVNKKFGPTISDTFVVMKLDGFTQLLRDAANGDPGRYYGKE